MTNTKVHAATPKKGSVGISGDLAPLSHPAVALIGKGKAECMGRS